VKDNKILILIIWGAIAVFVIAASILINLKTVENNPENNATIVYDGSEYNPVIKGVQ